MRERGSCPSVPGTHRQGEILELTRFGGHLTPDRITRGRAPLPRKSARKGSPGIAGILPAAGRRPAVVQAGRMPAIPEKSSLRRGILSWGGVVRPTMSVSGGRRRRTGPVGVDTHRSRMGGDLPRVHGTGAGNNPGLGADRPGSVRATGSDAHHQEDGRCARLRRSCSTAVAAPGSIRSLRRNAPLSSCGVDGYA